MAILLSIRTTAVLIGRFQPVTNAHREIIRRISQNYGQLIIIVGSAYQPRTYKNPWTFAERKQMLENVLDEMEIDINVKILPVRDSLYNDTKWITDVQTLVNSCATGKISLAGHKKKNDTSTFYLDLFPQWKFFDTGAVEPLNATDVREIYFKENANLNFLISVVPGPVFNLLKGWKDTPEYNQVIRERIFVEKYKEQYASLKYPPIFVTVDACVIQSGHILLVKRKAEPGKGLWALPGGYLNANTDKSLQDAMIRELREETRLKIPAPVLVGSISKVKVFDAVNRSPRGRIITHCFKIELSGDELPKVKGADDAEVAKWVPLSEIFSEEMFEDHDQIIGDMLGVNLV